MKVVRRIRGYQANLYNYMINGGKRAIAVWHRRAGKDEMALQITCELAHQRVGSYWHCLPDYSQARKAIWESVNPHTGRRRIDEAFPPEIRETTKENEMFIRFKNGSTWQLVGSNNYDALVGASIAGIVFSEWALAKPSAWGYIGPMMAENGGWAMFITTPRGRNHAKSMYDMAVKNPKWFAEIKTVEQTKALSSEQIEELHQDNIAIYGEDAAQAMYEQEFYCSFNAATVGAFYGSQCLQVRREGRLTDKLEPEPGYPIHRAWDLGYRDSTAIWWFQNLGSELRILDYYSAHHVGMEHYADVIKNRGWDLIGAKDYVPHDARSHDFGTGKSRVETLLSLGLSPIVVPRSKDVDGHQAIRSTLPYCYFHTRTEDKGFLALESYKREWDDNLNDFKQNAKHDWSSHGAKAFQYLCQSTLMSRPKAVTEEERAPPREPGQITVDEAWELNEIKRYARV